MRSVLSSSTETRFQQGLDEAVQHGASAAKLALQHEEKQKSEFEAGNVKSAGSQESLLCTAEVLVNGKKGTSTGNRIEDLTAIIERAIAVAKTAGSEAHFDAYPAPADITPVQCHSERTLALSREKVIDSCRRLDELLRAYNTDLYFFSIGERVVGESLVATTGGVCHSHEQTCWRLFFYAQHTRGTDIVMASAGRAWNDLDETFDVEAMAERVVADLRHSETNVEPPTGRPKAYLPPEALEMFLWPVTSGINGRSVAKGESPLADRLGEQILAPSLTIIDNPHQPFAPGACPIDSNGVPTKRQTLFEGGVLQRFLYDLDTAGLANAAPTGNNGCAPYNLMVQPGERPSDELIKSIDDGLFLRSFIGFGQSNVMNGDISCNVGLGFRIKNGKIVGRVKDTMIAGNIYELLANNVQLSSDLDYTGCFPHAVIEGLAVSSK